MKKIKLIGGVVLGLCFTCLFSNNVVAQYSTALGVRIGGTTGLAFKHVYNKPVYNNGASASAFEGIIGTFSNGFSLTGLIEKIKSLPLQGLYLYYGGGLHVASYDGSTYENFGRDVVTQQQKGVGFGVDGIVGIEYRLPNHIPIAFSLDAKPFIEIGTGNYVGFAFDPSISIKFVLK